ncbi:hypothetical protein E4P40_24995 [Blastococcus sp. CT_GayMR20]|uniref:NAD(P)/FAD-dependent oxidoreductase n=1 Tax=Blastococcus sp. CT_GayMR20 TaxID=2559609 RepID=UPI0010741BAB|nr:NAD(P)-binding protein [Blastococcus sp. CT_GayMR20]TFV66833.1 hypothetical protein E4P40_24995 [Blastococcus sp. CT_GayMR20]
MTSRPLVLGGGIGGILAAAALNRAGHRPVILEQDDLSAAATVRRGTPQAGQLHNLLTRAQVHLDTLLPGYRDALLRAGGVEAVVSRQTHVHELGIAMPERDLGLRLWSAPRAVIEQVARDLLPADVEIRERTRVTGIDVSDGEVRGVHIERDGRSDRLPGDLVVDAMGTLSRAADWTGSTAPVETTGVRQWYCTAVVQRPQAWRGRPDFWLVFPDHPSTRGALVSPWGPDRWYVSLSGVAGDPVPRTPADLVAFSETLPDPSVADLLRAAPVVEPPRVFGKPTAVWRHHELLPSPVTGVLPLGDAVGSLNPLFGQGISVAAWQAAGLEEAARDSGSLRQLTRRHLRHAAAACAAAWALMHVYAPPAGSDLPRLREDEWQTLAGLVRDDVDAHRRYVGMWHLLEPTSVLRELVPAIAPEILT